MNSKRKVLLATAALGISLGASGCIVHDNYPGVYPGGYGYNGYGYYYYYPDGYRGYDGPGWGRDHDGGHDQSHGGDHDEGGHRR